jgi:molybdenum cofactor cytidylyltransferase
MSHCGIVILAAGGSSRLGRPKQLAPWGGRTLLRRAVETALESMARPVVVVLGSDAEKMKGQIAGLDAQVVINPIWQRGIGTSIRAGAAALADEKLDALALILCDQPLIDAPMIDRLIAELFSSGKSISTAAYAGTLGTPAVFGAALFGELLALGDDQGGKAILKRHAADVHAIELPAAEVDLDTEEDLRKLQE